MTISNLQPKSIMQRASTQAPLIGESQFRGTPTTKDIFLTSKLWQYGVTANDSRKYRLVETRMKRLTKVLARFDRSGACREIYPAVSTILAKLKERELNYPEPQRLTWSRRTVFLYMERLEEAKIMKRGTLSRYHGTRRRVLDPAGLLSMPRECCTPTRRESCTRSKSLRSKKNHEASPVRKRTDTGAKAAPLGRIPATASQKRESKPLPSWTVSELREPANAVVLVRTLENRFGGCDSERLLSWALRPIPKDPLGVRPIHHPHGYVIHCAYEFFKNYPDYQQEPIVERLSPIEDDGAIVQDREQRGLRQLADQIRARAEQLEQTDPEAAAVVTRAAEQVCVNTPSRGLELEKRLVVIRKWMCDALQKCAPQGLLDEIRLQWTKRRAAYVTYEPAMIAQLERESMISGLMKAYKLPRIELAE